MSSALAREMEEHHYLNSAHQLEDFFTRPATQDLASRITWFIFARTNKADLCDSLRYHK